MFDFSTRMSGEQPVRMVLPQVAPPTDSRVILRRLWRGSGFIVLGGLFMVAVAVALLGLIPPRYTSSIQVLVDPSDLRVVENDVNARQPQADSGVSIAESQVRVIQSDSVLRRVIAKLHLDQDDEFVLPDGNNPTMTWIKGALGMLPPPASREAVFKSLDYLVTPPVITQFAELQDIVGRHLTDAAAGTVTPQEALKAMQAECQEKIDLTK